MTSKRLKLPAKNQKGLASVVMVSTLVVLIALVTLGFANLMSRALQNVRNRQLGSAASYAAQSAVGDAADYIKTQLTATPPQDPSATTCNALTGPGKPFDNSLSADKNIKYTCVLISAKSASLAYSGIEPSRSQIVKLVPSAPLASLMFSWQATDSSLRNYPSQANAGKLVSEVRWSYAKLGPMLRVSVYPIGPGGSLPSPANSKTFYFYPVNSGSVPILPLNYGTAQTGSLQSLPCGVQNPISGFSGSVMTAGCNIVINNLIPTGASFYYIRITPLYTKADVTVQGNDAGGQPVGFTGSQATVDVTAKANDVVKRLQAKVDISGSDKDIAPGDDAFPEYALRSAKSICKRLIVPDSGAVSLDSGSPADCGVLTPPPPPGPGGGDKPCGQPGQGGPCEDPPPARPPTVGPPSPGGSHTEVWCLWWGGAAGAQLHPGPCDGSEPPPRANDKVCVDDRTGALLHLGDC